MNKMKVFCYFLMLMSLMFVFAFCVHAAQNEELNYKMICNFVNTGKDNGYSGKNQIKKGDPHFGWEIGSFYIKGYSGITKDEKGNPVFLKTTGDNITLYFQLSQDINKLNGKNNLTISSDKNGYDEYFQTETTAFKKGALFVKHLNAENESKGVKAYYNFLSANAKYKADTKVQVFEEGDYEIALDYEIKDTPFKVFGAAAFPKYYNYRMSFKFSVRNGNCMVYPFDVKTKAELTNTSITENGFYLDLANSKYLDVVIKKEVLTEGADGLVEDVRFNKPAKSGEQYTDDGIYTITVTNDYTNQRTFKKIYVGTNKILKAHMVTGLSIHDINQQLALGADILNDGTIVPKKVEETENVETESNVETEMVEEIKTNHKQKNTFPIIICACGGVLVVAALLIIVCKKRNKSLDLKKENEEEEQ